MLSSSCARFCFISILESYSMRCCNTLQQQQQQRVKCQMSHEHSHLQQDTRPSCYCCATYKCGTLLQHQLCLKRCPKPLACRCCPCMRLHLLPTQAPAQAPWPLWGLGCRVRPRLVAPVPLGAPCGWHGPCCAGLIKCCPAPAAARLGWEACSYQQLHCCCVATHGSNMQRLAPGGWVGRSEAGVGGVAQVC
jgi:hypothetical protein